MDNSSFVKGALIGVGALGVCKLADSKLHLSNDLSFARRFLPLQKELDQVEREGKHVIDYWYETLAKNSPVDEKNKREAIVFERTSISFLEVEEQSNKVANWAVKAGFKTGDCVAVDIENRPELIYLLFGLSKAGLIVALLNFNIKKKALVHSIRVAKAKAVVFGMEVAEEMGAVASELAHSGISAFSLKGRFCGVQGPSKTTFAPSIDDVWESLSVKSVDKSLRIGRGGKETFAYIYTSGTTGLPKACIITNLRYISYASLFVCGMKGSSSDRILTALPLYHTAGGGLGLGAMVRYGCTLILLRKFSASKFWEDCTLYNATAVQYIGELCRYLLATPPSPFDKKHNVRIAYGNGLRPEIWDQFQRRFNVSQIGEFYGSTEGNTMLLNLCENYKGQGAVGRAGWLLLAVGGMKILKFDVESELPVRGKDGFCVEADTNEAGELVGLIQNKSTSQFSGYSDEESTKKKILSDVFVKGDKYFRTGDLLRRDANGYFYFVDRIGDTFRWQGENVSTMEVSEVLSSHPDILEANVYGVQVPGKDGRACMAAIVLHSGKKIDKTEFYKFVADNLPKFAAPLFLRFLEEVEVTGTFKHKKVELRDEGFNPAKVHDKMWWLDSSSQSYKDLDIDAYKMIVRPDSKL